MIIWITTVGWSPFAVINPIWAYCKENEKTPDKLFLLHTENMRVLKNLETCKKYLNEILREYSNNNFKEENLINYQIENETYELYSITMKKIIERELKDENAKFPLFHFSFCRNSSIVSPGFLSINSYKKNSFSIFLRTRNSSLGKYNSLFVKIKV